MKTLYESILDSDKSVIDRNKNIVLLILINIITNELPDFHVELYRKGTTGIYGGTQIKGYAKLNLEHIYEELKKYTFFKIESYNKEIIQLSFDFEFNRETVYVHLYYKWSGSRFRRYIAMNLNTKTQKTAELIFKLFDEKIPF